MIKSYARKENITFRKIVVHDMWRSSLICDALKNRMPGWCCRWVRTKLPWAEELVLCAWISPNTLSCKRHSEPNCSRQRLALRRRKKLKSDFACESKQTCDFLELQLLLCSPITVDTLKNLFPIETKGLGANLMRHIGIGSRHLARDVLHFLKKSIVKFICDSQYRKPTSSWVLKRSSMQLWTLFPKHSWGPCWHSNLIFPSGFVVLWFFYENWVTTKALKIILHLTFRTE